MRSRHARSSSDRFWAGFLAGTVAGGVIGAIFGTEIGKKARKRLEVALSDMRGRRNGHSSPPDLEVQTPPEEQTS